MTYWILGIIIVLCVVFVVLSYFSRKTPKLGLVDGRLRACPETPNCVCSEYQGKSYVEPLHFNETQQTEWERVKAILREMGGRIETEEPQYLRAVFVTKIFRFRDDVELRMEPEKGLIHIRSSSRVGHSDFGQNQKRVKKIRAAFKQSPE